MTDKEKAYDEAIKRAKKSYGNRITEEIFPELKEDDDERIKKAIIEFFESEDDNTTYSLVRKKDIIDWLKKQRNPKSYWKPTKEQYEALDYAYNSCPDTERGNYYEGILETLIEDLHKLEKQGEQEEPQVYETKDGKIIKYSETDEYKFVDPNFHEGDWVVYNNDVYQIVKREEGCNKLVTVFGIEKEFVNERNLSTARLWTIQDAKDGDVICYRDEISLYKNEIKNDNKQDTTFGGFVYYCCYDGKNFITNSFYLLTEQEGIDIYPATKEQRDVLMKVINNVGYKWDAENKELKKCKIQED